MDRNPREAAAERRAIQSGVNRMERGLAAVWLAVADLSDRDRLIVLNAALADAVRQARTAAAA